ncbi:Fibronectin type III domain protein [Anoxybacillus thermarum]|uniref:Fibronectin type III domain protein n=1 Tax=Anoxybacillus thermarum TaxID=404937 RepID=A0A0D0RW76_9BACL|nr:hypothetical protein [Anoxybacillus thermarum]KIQ93625.1 Fibronectin type III domain protein [Anoxybacillus thermarum]
MRYIIILFTFFLTVAVTEKAYAFENGLLEGKKATSDAYYSYDLDKITDNDLDTFGYIHQVYFSGKFYFDLDDEKTITSVFLKMNKDSGLGYEIMFKDRNNNILKKFSISDYGDGKETISRNGFTSISPINYVKKIEIHFFYVNLVPQDHIKIYEFDVYDSPPFDEDPPSDVVDLRFLASDSAISIFFSTPNDVDFAGTKIYLNDVLVATLDKTKTSYSFADLIPNTTYTIKITTFDETGNESNGVTTTVKTKIPIVSDVTDLQADAKYDRVRLSWTRPNSEFFSHAKIYRKKVEQKSFWDQIFGTTSVSAETTSDGYTPMFETNGTYWTDLTVTPDTTYSYKVTSVNIEGNESQGVTIETTTPSEPVPVLTGVATTQNENGDYVVTWTSPARGTVKLLIEGREYAQVDAATKQIVIKKEDMKTDFFGAYAATLIPIGEYGTKGQAVNVPSLGGKIDFPLSFQDFMETVVSILAWVAPFLLLSFVFIFWRPIFNFFRKSFAKGGRVKQ